MLDRVRFLGLVVVGVGLAVACSRSGFEDQYVPFDGGTAGTDAGVAGTGGSAGLGGTGATGGSGFGGSGFGGSGFGGSGFGGSAGGPTDGGNLFDAFPFPDSGPIANCVQCADKSCNSQVNACYNNSTCASGVVCALTSCLGGGGGLNFGCVLGCFNGDFGAAGLALQAFLCVSSNCGQQCIGAIGGGTPGGGGGPAPAPGPAPGAAPARFNPVAGGYKLVVPADKAQALGVPAGPMYVPPLEVLDSIPASDAVCGPNGASCQ